MAAMSIDRRVNLRNWFEAPYNRRGFQRVRELVPTSAIRRDERDPSPLPEARHELGTVRFAGVDGAAVTLDDYLEHSCTDGFIALLDGAVVYERYWNGLLPSTTHLLHSVSKSYCAALAGVLAGRGLLSPDDFVTELAPELAGTSFEGATVRHLLDMRTGTFCPEEYDTSDPTAPFRIYALQAGYGPLDGLEPLGILGHMRTLTNDGPHGGPFEYRSVLTNVLARVLETVADTPYPELLARELWAPLRPEYDAEIMLDPWGFPPVEGGMCCTLRDLARFGEAYRHDGRLGTDSVIPTAWVCDTRHGDDDTIAAYAAAEVERAFPCVMYRSGWWIIDRDRALAAIGIHGQMVFVDREHDLTLARLASEPAPSDNDTRAALLRAADAIVASARSA
jgi:CubicO group peptidase (beta-lactamase class C family)